MNKLLRYSLLICVLYLTLSLLISPETCIEAGHYAVKLCLDTVIPSLFPFFICSGLLSALGAATLCSRYLSSLMRPLFGVPGSGALAFILGIVSGYPTGAACAADLYRHGECTKSEAERMTAFCNNSGPLFIMGVVGVGMLSKVEIGRYLYLSHILSAMLTGVLLKFLPVKKESGQPQLPPSIYNNKKNTAHALGSVIDNSVFSMLKVCAFILLFSVIGAILPKCSLTPFFHALLEITGGIKAVVSVETDPILKLSLISFFIAFSGISILLQVSAVISPCGLSVMPYFFGKLLQGTLSFIITYILFTYFPVTKDVFFESSSMFISGIQPESIFIASLFCVAAVVAIILLLCLLSKLLRKN